jgi:hypothetical protein
VIPRKVVELAGWLLIIAGVGLLLAGQFWPGLGLLGFGYLTRWRAAP